jgi:hypothetical protein
MERSEIRDSGSRSQPRISLRFIRATKMRATAALTVVDAAVTFLHQNMQKVV